eukprot:CAMPEP_0197006912 /NCGR_PEP_ID=MMETSP1380-20130617/37894_1 /TAXON_ID=5936 /ORGANISM="Euplotes crassus, Strain CT5" /LENGTH=56 /DNA_ID=CAMNT_0042426763 /DNA_START=112 /DNA_END=282 /DNA_ORIENTATION=-
MKEYNLIRKLSGADHEGSDEETHMGHIHQEYEDSLHASSDVNLNTPKLTKTAKKNT